MLEKIDEKDTWQTLKESRKPIVLYGMGNGADQIIDVLNSYGLEASDVFASDGFVRGQLFHGKRVLTLREAEDKYDDFIVVMTFAVHDERTLDFVKELSKRHTLLSPTVPVSGGGLITRAFVKGNLFKCSSLYRKRKHGLSVPGHERKKRSVFRHSASFGERKHY